MTDPKTRPERGKRAIVWTEFDRLYVEGYDDDDEGVALWPSSRELAEKLGISPSSAATRVTTAKLRAARDAHRALLAAERQKTRAKDYASSIERADSDALTTAEGILALCRRRVDQIVKDEASTRERTGKSGVFRAGSKTLESLIRTATAAHALALRAVGDSPPELDPDGMSALRRELEDRSMLDLFDRIIAYQSGYDDGRTAVVVDTKAIETTGRES
jgi:hypothetical protein